MKSNHIVKAFMASIAALALAPFAKASPAPVAPMVLPVQQGSQPGKLPAENIDGTKAAAKTQNEAVKLIDAFNKARESGDQAGMDSATKSLEDLRAKDGKNLSVLTWLGYIYTVTGRHTDAISVLETLRGRSSDSAVNTSNLRNLAASYYLSRDYDRAITALTDLDAMEPGRADTLSLLGSAHVLSKNYEQAISPLTKARSLMAEGDSKRAVSIDLGIALYRTNRANEAMALFDELRNDSGLTADQLAWMGFIYLQNDRASDAVIVLEKAIGMDPNNPAVVNNLAGALMKRGGRGDEERAASLYEKLYGMVPENGTAAYNAGSMFLAQGEYAKAKPLLQKAADASNDPYAWNNLGRACEGLGQNEESARAYAKASDSRPDVAVFARNAGFAMVRLGNDDLAIKYFDRAFNKGDRDPKLVTNLGSALSRKGQHQKALGMLTMPEVAKSMAGNADYWYNLGVVHAGLNHPADAEKAYRKALEIRPDDIDSTNNLGLMLWNKGDYEGALAMFQKQAGLDKNSINARLNAAACFVKLDRINDAVEIWRGVLRTDGNRNDVRLDLADALWMTGDTPGARFQYAEVLKRNGSSARALNGIGMWTLLQTDHKTAEGYFRKAIASDRNLVPAYINLAIVLERQNKVRDAIAVLETAVKVAPNNAEAKKALARLKSR